MMLDPSWTQPAERQRYMEITGTLMYAAISTRPDIAHAVHYLASHMQAPTQRHMQAAERVLRYLAGTKDVGLVFGSRNGDTVGDSRGRKAQVQVDVCAFADADWANDKGDRQVDQRLGGQAQRRSGQLEQQEAARGRAVDLRGGAVRRGGRHPGGAVAARPDGGARLCTRRLVSTVYGDNQSAIAVSENGVKGERTKHVDVKYHFVTETVERGVVKLHWVPTAEQQADIFTKALAAPAFVHLRKQLMSC